MVKGAVFDMDGLMFGTEQLSCEGWLTAAKQLNYPITEETVAKIRGTNVVTSKQILKEEFGDSVSYDAAKQIRDAYVEHEIEEHGVPKKPGLIALLNYLKECRVKMAVATSTNRVSAEKYLKMASIYEYFDGLVFGDEVQNGKPAPDIFLAAANKIAIEPSACVVFEDSPHGIRAAYRANMKIIGVQDLTIFDDEILNLLDGNCVTLEDAIPLLQDL